MKRAYPVAVKLVTAGLQEDHDRLQEDYETLLRRSEHDLAEVKKAWPFAIHEQTAEMRKLLAAMLTKLKRDEVSPGSVVTVWNQLEEVLAKLADDRACFVEEDR